MYSICVCVYQMFVQLFKKKRIAHFDIKPQNILFTTHETGNQPRNNKQKLKRFEDLFQKKKKTGEIKTSSPTKKRRNLSVEVMRLQSVASFKRSAYWLSLTRLRKKKLFLLFFFRFFLTFFLFVQPGRPNMTKKNVS